MLSMQRMAWEQGTAAQAILEWGDSDLVVLMAKEAVLRISEDGRLGQINDNHGVTDPGSNGEAVLFAAKLTGEPGLKAGADRMLDYFLHKAPKTEDGTLYHIDDRPQVWIDSMYMAPPVPGCRRKAGRSPEADRGVSKAPLERGAEALLRTSGTTRSTISAERRSGAWATVGPRRG